MFAALPLLALPVVLYNLLAATLGGGFRSADAAGRLAAPLLTIRMPSHAGWTVGGDDLILIGALVILFVEQLKSAPSHQAGIVNHALAVLLFVICLVEFMVFPAFATSTFFLLMLMVLLDVVGGFIVSLVAWRRDTDPRGR